MLERLLLSSHSLLRQEVIVLEFTRLVSELTLATFLHLGVKNAYWTSLHIYVHVSMYVYIGMYVARYVCIHTYISNRACITLCGLWLVVCRDLCVRRSSDMTGSLFCVLAYDSLPRLCAGASLSRNTTLTSLNLPDNLIGDAGFGDLADSLPVRLRVFLCECVCVETSLTPCLYADPPH